MTMSLIIKQQRFVEEYMVDFNGTQAAIRAGYSKRTSKQIGSQLLTNIDVQSALQRSLDERSKRTEITADEVLRRLWTEATRTDEEGGMPSTRIRALELCGKHLSMFNDRLKVEHTGPTIEQLLHNLWDEKESRLKN